MLAVPWGAALGSLFGTLAGFGIATGWAIDHHLFGLGAGQSVSLVGVASGFVLGLVGGALLAVAGPLANPVADVVSIASGALVSIVLVAVIAAFERASLRIRGYRRLSRQEVRRIAPLVKRVADAMES
jgi:hypothetical protein